MEYDDASRSARRTGAVVVAATVVTVLAAVIVGTRLAGEGTGDDGPEGGRKPGSEPSISTGPLNAAGSAGPSYVWSDQPSPVVLRLPSGDVSLKPWTFCWNGPPSSSGTSSGVCADGWPGKPADLDQVGGVAAVPFWFGMEGWDFEATFQELGSGCPRSYTVEAQATGDHTFRLEPAGPAGRYQVDLFGRGEGDVITSFVWTTPTAGPIEPPDAYMGLVGGEPDDLHGYPLELSFSDLAGTPGDATVEVTVTAANGRPRDLEVRRSGSATCVDAGSVSFTGPEADARRVLALGPAPYTYDVTLHHDGTTYRGHGVWPRDERKDETPYVTLAFDPPLPPYVAK